MLRLRSNESSSGAFIASQEISATFKQHICDMQFNVVAVALKSCIAIIAHQKYVGTFYTVTIQKNKGEVFYYDLQKAIRSTV